MVLPDIILENQADKVEHDMSRYTLRRPMKDWSSLEKMLQTPEGGLNPPKPTISRCDNFWVECWIAVTNHVKAIMALRF